MAGSTRRKSRGRSTSRSSSKKRSTFRSSSRGRSTSAKRRAQAKKNFGPWHEYLAEFKDKHKSLTYKEALKAASKGFKKWKKANGYDEEEEDEE